MRGPKAVVAPADVLGKVGQPYVEFQEPFVLVRSQTTGRQPSGGQNRPKLVPGILVVRSLSGLSVFLRRCRKRRGVDRALSKSGSASTDTVAFMAAIETSHRVGAPKAKPSIRLG